MCHSICTWLYYNQDIYFQNTVALASVTLPATLFPPDVPNDCKLQVAAFRSGRFFPLSGNSSRTRAHSRQLSVNTPVIYVGLGEDDVFCRCCFFSPFTPMQIIVKWVFSSVGNKCSILLQHKLFYHFSSDRWLQHVEPLWAHLGFAAPLIPWYWCRGSPVECEGTGEPSKLEPRRLWVGPHWQQHFHNALLPTQQLCCVAGRVIFSLIFML